MTKAKEQALARQGGGGGAENKRQEPGQERMHAPNGGHRENPQSGREANGQKPQQQRYEHPERLAEVGHDDGDRTRQKLTFTHK